MIALSDQINRDLDEADLRRAEELWLNYTIHSNKKSKRMKLKDFQNRVRKIEKTAEQLLEQAKALTIQMGGEIK